MKGKSENSVLRSTPLVAAVGDRYIICIPVKKQVLMSVKVGAKTYYCHSNGIRITDADVQKFEVPMEELDKACSYTVTYEVVKKRTNRECIRKAPVSMTYSFRPVTKEEDINVYAISDVHGLVKEAIESGGFFKDRLDLLIMNGDVSSSSMCLEDIMVTYDIAEKLTKGEIPCIVTRGNHDLRGVYAPKLTDLLPDDNGKPYYSVNLGPFRFLILDCGEDKVDEHREYSHTVCCHEFRLAETEFLKEELKKSTPGSLYRIVISHVPFNVDNTNECKGERPFNIERELYTSWCELLKEQFRPDFMIAGHLHTAEVIQGGSEKDVKGLGRPTVVSGVPVWNEKTANKHIGAGLNINKKETKVYFTDAESVKEEVIVMEEKK